MYAIKKRLYSDNGIRLHAKRSISKNIVSFNFMSDDHWNNEVTLLFRENVLPRLECLERDLAMLRDSTWPVCQAIKDSRMNFESVQLRNIREKRSFFRWFDPDEIKRLLGIKARLIGSSSYYEELRMIQVQ
jgi:hypothetical protein